MQRLPTLQTAVNMVNKKAYMAAGKRIASFHYLRAVAGTMAKQNRALTEIDNSYAFATRIEGAVYGNER